MSSLMDPAASLNTDERNEYYSKLRETVESEAVSAGFAIPGSDPYAKDWDMNWEWPASPPDDINAEVTAATFVVGKRNKRTGRVRESTLRRQVLNGQDFKKMREAAGWGKIKEWGGQPDPFAYGNNQSLRGNTATSQYLPLWPGPVTRQLYWSDYWMMSAKAFEAYNHDPVSWRCIHLKAEFALGRGLDRRVTYSSGSKKGQTYDAAQKVYDEFWKRNKMERRLDTIARDYCWAGEQFLRYFKSGPKLTVRSLDPASIYDLITDPEDIETVFAYHQQFQTAYQLYPPERGTPPTGITAPTGSSTPGAVTKYIIRQILPQEVDHYKTNASGYERRGRSDLYPALGWIKRLRDYLTAHVIHADMVSRICWDLQVSGNQGAITKIQGLLFPNGQAPQPGTIFGHNTASKLEPIVPQGAGSSSASRGDPVLDALVTMTSLSGGVPKDWLGFGIQNTRAGALVATEPAAKSLQELQGTLEEILHDQFDRVMIAASITDAEVEITFPSITAEDRQQKLDDLGTMESNGWLSKQTSAKIAGKEMDITNYSFDSEQALIAGEFDDAEEEGDEDTGLLGPDGKPIKRAAQGGKIRRPMLLATKRQAPKLDPTKASQIEDEPAGLGVPLDGETPLTPPGGNQNGSASNPVPGSVDGTGRTVAGGGNHKNSDNPMTASGQKDIRKESTSKLRSKESGTITLSHEDLNWLLMRERRRRPDDQVFRQESDEYRTESQKNLEQLAGSLREEGGPKTEDSS